MVHASSVSLIYEETSSLAITDISNGTTSRSEPESERSAHWAGVKVYTATRLESRHASNWLLISILMCV